MPTRGFTAAVSVFRGTPPQKPFEFVMSVDRFAIQFRLAVFWRDKAKFVFGLVISVTNL